MRSEAVLQLSLLARVVQTMTFQLRFQFLVVHASILGTDLLKPLLRLLFRLILKRLRKPLHQCSLVARVVQLATLQLLAKIIWLHLSEIRPHSRQSLLCVRLSLVVECSRKTLHQLDLLALVVQTHVFQHLAQCRCFHLDILWPSFGQMLDCLRLDVIIDSTGKTLEQLTCLARVIQLAALELLLDLALLEFSVLRSRRLQMLPRRLLLRCI